MHWILIRQKSVPLPPQIKKPISDFGHVSDSALHEERDIGGTPRYGIYKVHLVNLATAKL